MQNFIKFDNVEAMNAYADAFYEHLTDCKLYVKGQGVLLEKMPERMNTVTGNNFVLFFEKNARYNAHFYPKGFVLARYEGEEIYVPLGYVKEHGLTCYDEDGNSFSFDEDTRFSHSCGYYDSSRYTAFNNRLYDEDEIVTLHNGNKCFRDNACWVESQDDYYHVDDCVYSDHCNEYILSRDAIHVEGYGYISDDDPDFFTCDSCNNTFHNDEYAEDGYCQSCYDENHTKLDLMSYNTDVLRHAAFGQAQYKYKGRSVFCGIELEVEASDYDSIDAINFEINEEKNKSFDDTYFVATEDGSLDAKLGLEFIFSPDNLANFELKLNDFVARFGDNLAVIAGNGYGLHIHISSHHLSNFDKVKIQNFVSENEAFYRMIGKREQTGYQAKKMLTKAADKKVACKARYGMVNILPSETIEFRYPKSIVCVTHILANIELCFATVSFISGNYSNVINADYDSFIAYIRANAKTYKTLINLI